jgi:hypothetical protein
MNFLFICLFVIGQLGEILIVIVLSAKKFAYNFLFVIIFVCILVVKKGTTTT